MILSPVESLNKLDSFFKNESSFTELNLPELVMIDTDTGYNFWNRLIINSPNLKTLNLENMQQSPYILVGENLEEINLEQLQEVEFNDVLLNSSISSLPTRVLQNTKIQTLNLPNFVGTRRPIPQGTDDISNSYSQYASFWNNYWLKDVSLGNSMMTVQENSNCKFNGFWFRNNYFLKYLRLNYPYVIPLIRTAGFNTTPIGDGDGHIYVPDNLVNSYKLADNWSSFKDKIKSLSDYEIDIASENASFISDSWETILENCSKGTVSNYTVGQKKIVKINGIPTVFILVGKNQDILSSDNTLRAPLSWLGATISNFTPINVSDSFDNTNPRQYNYAVNFRSALTSIYEGIEPTVKAGIKSVKKYGKGFDNNNTLTDYPSIETGCWPPSQIELGLIQGVQAGTFTYQYFQTDRWSKINYRLGLTNINEVNGSKICIALRDYTNTGSNYPDLLRSLDSDNTPMEVVTNVSTRPYLIVGFCT